MPSPPSSPFNERKMSWFYASPVGTNDSRHDEHSRMCSHYQQEEIAMEQLRGFLDPIPIDPLSCKVVGQLTLSELYGQENGSQLLTDFSSMFQSIRSNSTINAIMVNSTISADDQESTHDPSFIAASKGPPEGSDDRWDDRFNELCNFQRRTGHCNIPTRLDTNPCLARWCKRQRYQYKLKQAGYRSTLTEEREQKLNDLGFVWNSHSSAWERRFLELVEFQKQSGHTYVPRSMGKLGSWVKSQRRQHALYVRGEKSHLTPSRVAKMDSLGFEWVGSKNPFPRQTRYER